MIAIALCAWVSAVTSGAEAIASLSILAWFSTPGIVLWNRSGTVAGSLLAWSVAGTAMTLVAIAAVGAIVSVQIPVLALLVPAVLSAATAVLPRSAPSAGTCAPSPTPVSFTCLCMSVIAALAMATPAWLRAGTTVDAGVDFQAFFSADFFKHLGIANGLAQGDLPPRDLFGAGGVVHYYWLQHIFGGSLLNLLPNLDPVRALLAIGMWQTAIFAALLYTWATSYGSNPVTSMIAVVVAIASLSMDGLASLIMSGSPWEGMQSINMEALDLGYAIGYAPSYPAASTLFRLALYIPQHQLCAIFFICWAVLSTRKQQSPAERWARIGILSAMPGTSLLLGVPAVGAALLFQAMSAFSNRDMRMLAPELSGAAISLILPLATEMVVPGATAFGLAATQAAYEPPLAGRLLLLPLQWFSSIGVMLPAGIIGMMLLAHGKEGLSPRWIPLVAISTACFGYIATQTLLAPSRLRIDAELKLSFLLAVGLTPAAAFAADNLSKRVRRPLAILAVGLVALGLPSLVHDIVWHSCRSPLCVGGAGRSTTIPYADYQALTWIRQNTGLPAVIQQSVQTDFIGGGRDVWIPSIAGRAVHSSHRASNAAVKTSLEEMTRLFDPEEAAMPSVLASSHRIDYVYLSRSLEGKGYDALRARFNSDAGMELAYRNSSVEVWHLKGAKK